MTNLAVYQPTSLADAQALAKMWAGAGLVPQAFRGKPNDILLMMARGADLGLSPVQSLHAFYVISGRVGMYADAMIGVCLSKPFCKYFRLVSTDDNQATYETLREGMPEPVRMTYTMEQAKKAGLASSNPNYQKHPAAQLRARCGAALARVAYPDLVAGIYEPSELDEIPQAAPERNRRTQEVTSGGGLVAATTTSPAPADVVTVEPVTGEILDDVDQTPDEVIRVTFGKNAGKAISDLTIKQLEAYIEIAEKTLADPAKERFHAEQEQWIAHLEAELARRG